MINLSFCIFVVFLLGIVIGSFINALQYRIQNEMSISKGRSICPHCKKQLAWHDNIPVFSFLFLRGKCRQCKKPISWQYPVVELLTGFAFVAVALPIISYQLSVINVASLLCLFFITFCLILIGLHDQKTTYVLSGYVYAAIVATLIYLLVTYTGFWGAKELFSYFKPNVLSSLVAMLPFALLFLISKGTWMGAGDIEIAALLGFLLGWPNFMVALYFAFLVGAIWGLVKVYFFKNANMKSEMPFAPFLIAGIFFALLFADKIISIYVNMVLG